MHLSKRNLLNASFEGTFGLKLATIIIAATDFGINIEHFHVPTSLKELFNQLKIILNNCQGYQLITPGSYQYSVVGKINFKCIIKHFLSFLTIHPI